MKVNFKIIENYALSYQGRHIDLHNNYEFTGMEYSTRKMTLTLRWIKSSGDWIKDDELLQLMLVHKSVSYLSISPRDLEMPFSEDSCLSDITFFPSSARDVNDSIISKTLPAVEDDILYIFQSEQIIRVHCEEIELITI